MIEVYTVRNKRGAIVDVLIISTWNNWNISFCGGKKLTFLFKKINEMMAEA